MGREVPTRNYNVTQLIVVMQVHSTKFFACANIKHSTEPRERKYSETTISRDTHMNKCHAIFAPTQQVSEINNRDKGYI